MTSAGIARSRVFIKVGGIAVMTGSCQTVEIKRFEYDEKREQVIGLETMISEFERLAEDLDRQIAAEQQAAGITNAAHFAYPTYAKAASTRRDNLRSSAADLRIRLERAKDELAAASEQLKMSETAEGFEAQRQKRSASRKPGGRTFGSAMR